VNRIADACNVAHTRRSHSTRRGERPRTIGGHGRGAQHKESGETDRDTASHWSVQLGMRKAIRDRIIVSVGGPGRNTASKSAEQTSKPLLEGDGGLVAKVAARPTDVGARMANVSCPWRRLLRNEVGPEQTVQGRNQVEDADTAARSNVVDRSR